MRLAWHCPSVSGNYKLGEERANFSGQSFASASLPVRIDIGRIFELPKLGF
jgi:hypothetical protein